MSDFYVLWQPEWRGRCRCRNPPKSLRSTIAIACVRGIAAEIPGSTSTWLNLGLTLRRAAGASVGTCPPLEEVHRPRIRNQDQGSETSEDSSPSRGRLTQARCHPRTLSQFGECLQGSYCSSCTLGGHIDSIIIFSNLKVKFVRHCSFSLYLCNMVQIILVALLYKHLIGRMSNA